MADPLQEERYSARRKRAALLRLAKELQGTDVGTGLAVLAVVNDVHVYDVIVKALEAEAQKGLDHMAGLEGPGVVDMAVKVSRLAVSAPAIVPPSGLLEKQEDYLEWLTATEDLAAAARGMNISTSLPYAWARQNEEFRRQWNERRSLCGLGPVGGGTDGTAE